MKLRLELLLNNGRKLIAVEESVSFSQSLGETLGLFMISSRSLAVKLFHWLAGNQDEFVQLLKGKK